MKIKRYRKLFVVVALIGTLFMFGAGVKNADADTYIDYCGLSNVYVSYYGSRGLNLFSYAFNTGDTSVLLDAYEFMNAASSKAMDAYNYALYSTVYYAYDAYLYSYYGYLSLYDAAFYAYYAWYYADSYYADLSMLYGSDGTTWAAMATYYSAVLY